MVLPTTFTMARARWPRRLASRNAASVSAVSPDCEEQTAAARQCVERTSCGNKIRRELDLNGDVVAIFSITIFAHQRCVLVSAAGGDDDAVHASSEFRGAGCSPPNFAVAFQCFQRQFAQRLFNYQRLLENLLEHEVCANFPRPTSSWLNQIADLHGRRGFTEIHDVKPSGVMAATS